MENTPLDFLAIGDVFNDTFIELEDAQVTCDINHANCTISMKFGDKLPYTSASVVRGVGNAGNAATSASRLGVASALLTMTGSDDDGEKIFEHFRKEKVSEVFMQKDATLPTNNAYVLKYGPERTILVKQEAYPYILPTELLNAHTPKWIYLTSIGKSTVEFHHQLVAWLAAHPETKLTFQPGTFQMQLGKEVLADVYKATTLFVCNKEESQRILGITTEDIHGLISGLHALGPKQVIITDGVKGLTASDGTHLWYLPMYPDPAPPVSRTGAGDATASTITSMLATGMSFEEALRYGPVNSMSVVQKVGAQEGLLSRGEIEMLLAKAPADYQLKEI